MKKTAIVMTVLAMALPAAAEERGGLSVGARVSTLGLGLEVEYPFTDTLHGRAVVNHFDYDYEVKETGATYKGDLALQSFGLIGDWHPFNGGFRFSLGALLNNNELSARATEANATGGFEFGDTRTYAGTANVKVDFETFAPYVGVGWGGSNANGFGFNVDLGALYQQEPRLTMRGNLNGGSGITDCDFSVSENGTASVSGNCGSIETLQADLSEAHDEVTEDLDKFKWYPVLSIGVEYRF